MFVVLKKDYFGQKAGTTLDIDVQPLPQRLRPFVQRCEREVQHLAGFQAGQSRRVDPHALGYLGQRQFLGL